jgi:O-antigen ligase
MITGDGPSSTIRLSTWPTPLPFLAWEWLYIVLLAAGAFCLVAGGAVRSWKLPHARTIVLPLVLLVAACLLSSLLSQVPSLSVTAMVSVLGIVAACWIFAVLLEDDGITRAAWPAIAVAILLLAARVVLWRRDEGLNVAAYQIFNNAWVGKLQLAWVFNLFAPLLVARAMGEPRRRLAALYGFAWLVAAVATYLLFSRMGAIVFAVTTLGIFVVNPAYWRKVLLIVLVGAVIGAALVARSDRMSRFVVATIIEPDRNPGVELRLSVWRDALRLFKAHPIAGTGLGTFDEMAYTIDGTMADPVFRRAGWHAHNVYLHVLAETGALGLLAWCYLWYTILARLISAWKRADARYRLFVAGALWSVVAFLVLSVSEVLIGARVHASLRMNLTIGLIVVLGLQLAAETTVGPSPPAIRDRVD